MTSIFEKARTLVLSNIHSLLDAAIDLNSIGAIKQHVRDLEKARDSIADEAAVADGRATALDRDIRELESKKVATEENIDLLLTDGDDSNDHHAMPLAEQVMQIDDNIAAKQAELVDQRALVANLEDARMKLTTKHAEMLRSLNRLESMERAAVAREQAAKALSGAAAVAGVDVAASVDSVTQRVRDRDAVSKARFDRALAGIGDEGPADAVRASQAAALIAARRAQLQKKEGADAA